MQRHHADPTGKIDIGRMVIVGDAAASMRRLASGRMNDFFSRKTMSFASFQARPNAVNLVQPAQ
jgi:hypothetical protein